MTIVFFSTQYLPTPGGVERYTWNLARRCVRAGHRAVVVTAALSGLPLRETDPDGIEIVRLPSLPVMGGRFPVVRPGAMRQGGRLLDEVRPDFCVIQTRMYPQSVWAARACRRRGLRAVVIDHSTGYMMPGRGPAAWLGRRYEHAACGIVRRCGFDFYGVSGDVVRWLQAFGVTAKGVLPNAVDPAALAALADGAPRTDWRARLGLHGEKLVAFVGRLIPEKGAAELAKAMRTLPDCAAVLAGDGPELERLRRSAPPNVHCVGALPHRETVQLLAQADCYCLPTRYAEGFPTTLLEAAACGCPIVCTRTAGTAELMPGPGYGVLLDDASPAAVAAGLRAVLDDPARAAARAAAVKKRADGLFTWDAVFATIMELAAQK